MSTTSARTLAMLDRRFATVENFLNAIAAASIFAFMFFGTLSILLRGLFNAPILGAIDLTEMFMAGFVFIGMAYSQRHGAHIRMDVAIGQLRGRARMVGEAACIVVAMMVVAMLAIGSAEHAYRSWELGGATQDIEIRTWPAQALVPFSLIVLFCRLALNLAGYLRLAAHPDATPIAVPAMADAHNGEAARQ